MNIEKYLERIKVESPVSVNKETLFLLHQQHLLTIPFENLDIFHQIPFELNIESFYDKIINQQRGGFCYELNGLFAQLLKAIGFKTYYISARLHENKNNYGPEFDHMAIIVELGSEQWLLDVGMGEGFTSPLNISDCNHELQNGKYYRISKENSQYLSLQKSGNAEATYNNVYLFSTLPRVIGAFKEMFDYNQTSPDSKFVKKSICSIATKEGRTTLTESKLILTNHNKRTLTPVHNEEEYTFYLKKHFNLVFEKALNEESKVLSL